MVVLILDNDHMRMHREEVKDMIEAMNVLAEFSKQNDMSFNGARRVLTNEAHNTQRTIGDMTQNGAIAGSYQVEYDL